MIEKWTIGGVERVKPLADDRPLAVRSKSVALGNAFETNRAAEVATPSRERAGISNPPSSSFVAETFTIDTKVALSGLAPPATIDLRLHDKTLVCSSYGCPGTSYP